MKHYNKFQINATLTQFLVRFTLCGQQINNFFGSVFFFLLLCYPFIHFSIRKCINNTMNFAATTSSDVSFQFPSTFSFVSFYVSILQEEMIRIKPIPVDQFLVQCYYESNQNIWFQKWQTEEQNKKRIKKNYIFIWLISGAINDNIHLNKKKKNKKMKKIRFFIAFVIWQILTIRKLFTSGMSKPIFLIFFFRFFFSCWTWESQLKRKGKK